MSANPIILPNLKQATGHPVNGNAFVDQAKSNTETDSVPVVQNTNDTWTTEEHAAAYPKLDEFKRS